jgi:prophage antirepressor-like protein
MNTSKKAVQTYQFQEQNVRIILDKDNEPWWVLGDVCKVLDIENPSRLVERLEPEHLTKSYVLANDGKLRDSWIVNEAGLYDVILGSHKPEAKRFKKWVLEDVLPTIRRTGRYDIRDRDIIAGFLSPVFLPWEKRFELDFYREISRVYGQPIPKNHGHSPMFASFIARYVYDILPKPVREQMDIDNPILDKKTGDRKYLLHQMFKEERVKDFLIKRIDQIMTIARTCPSDDKDTFVKRMADHDRRSGVEVQISAGQRLLLSMILPNQLSLFDNASTQATEESEGAADV